MAASALLALRDPHGSPFIPFEHSRNMTDKQVISLFQWDHYPIPHAHDGPTVGWNLLPRFIGEHREKTRKIDIPMIAKTKRIQRAQEAFVAAIMAKGDAAFALSQEELKRKLKRKKKWPSRPFPKRKKK
jgi:hypothetical protein